MTQKRSPRDSEARFGPVNLWLHYGRSTISTLKGYSILFLKGEFGTLNSRQQEVMQQISRLTDEALDSWNEFADFFHLNSPDNQPISPAEIGLEEFALLQGKIINPALISLQRIRGDSDNLSHEKHGTLTNEQREWLNELRKGCDRAIQGWHEPMDYFNKR